MNIDTLEIVVVFLLGVSLASERVISMLKTLLPALADDPGADPNTAWSKRWRPLIIQGLSFGICCGTVALLTPAGLTLEGLTTEFRLADGLELRVWVVGLLASGGSAFWNNFLGYTKAVKDLKKKDAAAGGAEPAAAPAKVPVEKVFRERANA